MSSSYIQCNSCKVTLFLDHRFISDLSAKKKSFNTITLHLIHN